MSTYSVASKYSHGGSRPGSYAFPAFHSSLPYTLVRDFAFPIVHPWHYGPPPEISEPPSGNSTPASERQRRSSDPANATWDGANPQWSAGPWGGDGFFSNHQLPQMAYGDGPPYSEDEDLHSPVVVSSRHKKNKSTFAAAGSRPGKRRGRSPQQDAEEDDNDLPPNHEGSRSYFAGVNGDGTETYYIGEEDESANGPGGELVTYPPDQARQSLLAPNTYASPRQRDSHFATLPNRSYAQEDVADDSSDEDLGMVDQDTDSRYSRDYQFTIASPDEEMHGKAVALFDFTRESASELPLKEGQIIWVSYRHGQGWLVAEDPKTGESGLVPEEFVRLLRDIEGGWSALSGEQSAEEGGPSSPVTTMHESVATPTQAEPGGHTHSAHGSSTSNGGEKRPPVVSTFSTSSKDLNPYPHHLLGEKAGGTPPQVVHYSGSPTVTSPSTGPHGPRGFEEIKGSEGDAEVEEESEAEKDQLKGRR